MKNGFHINIVQINALHNINACVWHCFSFIYILYIQSSVMLAIILRIYIYIYISEYNTLEISIICKGKFIPPFILRQYYGTGQFSLLCTYNSCSPTFSVYMFCLKGHRKRTFIMNIIGERTRFHLMHFNFM